MRYVSWAFLILGLAACGKKSAPDAVAGPFPVSNMTCTTSTHETLCATAAGVTQDKPAECSTLVGSGGSGIPLDDTGRTSGVYYTVDAVYDCGVRAGQRCVFVEYVNGWQDMRCDDYQMPLTTD